MFEELLRNFLDAAGRVIEDLWSLLGDLPPAAREVVLLAALVIVGWSVLEILIFGRSSSQYCNARRWSRRKGDRMSLGHCRRGVSPGSTSCGVPGHTRWWILEDLLGVLVIVVLMLRVVGLY